MSTSKNNSFDAVVAALPDAASYIVAYSGGVDSHVLLHCLAERRDALHAPLMAVHVDHGIQSQSGAWRAHCERVCLQLNIPFHALQTDGNAAPGESPEAAARSARYRALEAWLPEEAALLTAQHRDDQAETVLLQLFRGAGPRGLSAMPASAPLGRGVLLRPFLEMSRAEILAAAQASELDWIEDPSNADTRYDRNHLRHEVLPRLQQRWPGLHAVLARVAAHQSEQAGLADALAEGDYSACQSESKTRLQQSALLTLEPARQRNLLRYWIHQRGFTMPSQAVLERVREEMLFSREDAQPVVSWGDAELRRFRGELYLMQTLPAHDTSQCVHWDLSGELDLDTAGGVLSAQPVTGEGLCLPNAVPGLDVRFRRGGESLRLPGASHHRKLKNVLQEYGVPDWERERLPLLYAGDTLVAVPGITVCEGFQAQAGQAGFTLGWSRL
ncbi:tRNA(Ile)-lysidine synthetase [hydrothermal vent metagenome]|uniref:tRNA(Ile)-lysidine synthetase n=1 Tax=hydrothermal vent metagenome TaxID=652676 RepID=A0A3B0YKR7_9ZZZZ